MKSSLKKLITFAAMLIMIFSLCAVAEDTMQLPKDLKIVKQYAFYGTTSIDKVVVPEGVTEIHSKAFANSTLKEITLPESITFIAENAFEGCGEVAVTVSEDSYAYERCVEIGLISPPKPPEMESEHPYPDDFDYTWTYDAGEGAESVTLTFSENTETEEDYDFIYVYTIDDVEIGKYSGTQLAGQTITIDGAGFKLRLVSDEAWDNGNTFHGFEISTIDVKRAIPLAFDSITAESSTVTAGETIRWTVATIGGKDPVFFDYAVLLGEQEMTTGTVEAPNPIEYKTVRVGEYRLSVIVRDSNSVALPVQISDPVAAAVTTAYPESTHPYNANTDQTWVYAAEENVESLIITFSDETKTQGNYDYIYIYDQAGVQVGKYSGTQLAGQTIEIMGTAFTIRLTSNGYTQYHGFTITNIEKYVPGPLNFVSLKADKSKAKTGDLITWTMETEGGRRPVTYDYTVALNDEIIFSGSVIRPEQITYVPMATGDYTLSVVAKDAEGNELPAETSKVRITERDVTSKECFTYEAINGLYARITKYTGTDTAVVIPETLGEYTVQEIGGGAFRDNAELISVALPDTVIKIHDNAFRNCDSLSGVNLGNSVTSIGSYAFYDCDALKAFIFPNCVTSTGEQILRYCDNLVNVIFPTGWIKAGASTVADCPKLTKIILPEGLTTVPSNAFRYCKNLKEVSLPTTLQSIGTYAFGDCTGFDSFEFNEGLITISDYAFQNCSGLTEIVIPDSVTYVSGFDGCKSLKSIQLPAALTTIGDKAFHNCEGLTEIVFPNGLKAIEASAFEGCKYLTKALLPDSVESIDFCAFKNCKSLTEFRYPLSWSIVDTNYFDGVVGGYIFEGCENLISVSIPEGITKIPSYAFHNAKHLKNISLPSTLVTIGSKAFHNCEGLTEVIFPNGLKAIEASAFEGCKYLTKALLPDSVESIDFCAFKNCKSLTEFRYPLSWSIVNTNYFNGVVGGYIFEGCENLTSVSIPEGITKIPSYAFHNAKHLKNISLPSTLVTIGSKAFHNCEGLTEIIFPNGLKAIEASAFEGCKYLTKALLPDSVESIDFCAFKNCKSLTEFHYPLSWSTVNTNYFNGVVGGYIFEGCENLTSVSIPEGITKIPAYAFHKAKHLANVSFPSTLVTIGNKAFWTCEGLTEIVFPNGLKTIGESAFQGSTNLIDVYIPSSVNSIGKNAFANCPNLTISCEWGSVALQYAKDNLIPYYYLSLTEASIPSGTLYKGDSFDLYGYVRSSEKITSVTATLFNSDKSKVLQTVTVQPNVENFNLNGYVNGNIKFGKLDLGNYAYTLIAATGDKQETLIDSRFTIVPPPLRISKSNLVIPSGLASLNGSLGMSGTIRSNYPISEVKITLLYQNKEYKTYSVYPNAYSYDLAGLNNAFDLTKIPDVDLAIRIDIKSNGQNRIICESDFLKGNFEGDVSDETYQAMIRFAKGNDAVGFFDMQSVTEVLGDMDAKTAFLIALNSRSDWFKGQVASLFNGGNNTHLIELYEKDICDTLLSMSEFPDLLSSASDIEKDMHFFIMGLVKTGSCFLSDELDALDTTGLFSEETLSTMKGWDNAVGYIKDAEKALKWTDETARGIITILLSQENALRVLDSIEAASANGNIKEYQVAMERIRAKYVSQTNTRLLIILEEIEDKLLSDSVDDVLTALIELGADWGTAHGHLTGGSLYTLTNLAIDVGLKLTGVGNIADVYETFLVQSESYLSAIQAYGDALDAVRFDKDTSDVAINKLKICFDYAKACGIKIHETILEIHNLPVETFDRASKYLYKLQNYTIE